MENVPVLNNKNLPLNNLKGTKLISVLIVLGFIALFAGILIGQLPSILDPLPTDGPQNNQQPQPENVYVEKAGRVVYVDPANYPGEKISYKLVADGKDLYLLTANDDKLKFIEGGTATLKGTVVKKIGDMDVLQVDKVVFN